MLRKGRELERFVGALHEREVRLRIFRRYRALSAEKVRAMRPRMLASLLAIAPRTLGSRRYRRLPLLMTAALLRSLRGK